MATESYFDGRIDVEGEGRFICHSVNRQGENVAYITNIFANDLNGHCECDNFLYKRQKFIGTQDGRCKHIRACRDLVLDALLQREVDAKPSLGEV